MARFDDSFLADVRDRVKISEVIGRDVTWAKKSRPSIGDYWACCPFHSESGASFHVVDKKGFYKCFACDVSGDHFKYLRERSGMSFHEAVREVAGMAGMSLPDARPPTPEEKAAFAARQKEREAAKAKQERDAARQQERRIKSVKQIWQETVAFAGSPAQAYLEYRCSGLSTFVDASVIRCHMDLDVPVEAGLGARRSPALVARLQNASGAGVAIWRIYINADGTPLLDADGRKIKMGLGPSAGAAVRMGGLAKHIGGAEGIETALAVRALGVTTPVWPMLSTGGLIGFQFPEGVERFTYFPDPDPDKVKFKKRHDGTTYIAGAPGMEAAHKFKAAHADRDIRIADMGSAGDALETLQLMKGVPVR